MDSCHRGAGRSGPERGAGGGNTNIVSASVRAPRAGDEYVSLYTAHTRGPGCAGMENRVSGINDIENDREQIGNGFARPTRGDGNVPHSYLPSPAPPTSLQRPTQRTSVSFLQQLLRMAYMGGTPVSGGKGHQQTLSP